METQERTSIAVRPSPRVGKANGKNMATWNKYQSAKPTAPSAVGMSLNMPRRAVLLDPERLFLHLTEATVPHGHEEKYYRRMLTQCGFSRDGLGNWVQAIGTDPTVCFMSHLDTASSACSRIQRVRQRERIKTDGKTILGADDRAGVTVLLSMVARRVPGLYYLFSGEESGCIGSKKVAAAGKLPAPIQQAVSFDRRGYESVITHQQGIRCASDDYAAALAEALQGQTKTIWKPDDTGLYTDSDSFAGLIAECTNISVGYFHAHGSNEEQDVSFLTQVVDAACAIDWANLPIVRDPEAVEYVSGYASGTGHDYGYGCDDDWSYSYYGSKKEKWNSHWEKTLTTESDVEQAVQRVVAAAAEGNMPRRSDLYTLVELPSHKSVDRLEEVFELLAIGR